MALARKSRSTTSAERREATAEFTARATSRLTVPRVADRCVRQPQCASGSGRTWICTASGGHALATLLEPRCPIILRRPQAPALPAGLRIVDARVETLGIEAEWVRHPQHHHLAVDERREAVVFICGRDRHVIAETNRIVLIDPGVVARLGAVVADAGKTRPGIFVEGPALGAMIAGCGRTA